VVAYALEEQQISVGQAVSKPTQPHTFTTPEAQSQREIAQQIREVRAKRKWRAV
jgi:hypothetical protein